MTISKELFEVLRCPYCVTQGTRAEGDDPGQLELVKDGTWLVCKESGHKYPIREGVPVILIDEGSKWVDTAVEDLPEPGPLVDEKPDTPNIPDSNPSVDLSTGPNPMIFVGIAAVLLLVLLVAFGKKAKKAKKHKKEKKGKK